MGLWFRDWGTTGYITYQLYNDPLANVGFSAWCILMFIFISSVAPIRQLSYETFAL